MSVSHMFLSSLKNFFLMRKFIKYSPVGQFPFFQLSTLVISQSSSFLTKQQCSIKLTTSSFLNTFFTWLWCISLSLLFLSLHHWLLLLSHLWWLLHIYLISKHCLFPGLNLWTSLYIYNFMGSHGFKYHLYATS